MQALHHRTTCLPTSSSPSPLPQHVGGVSSLAPFPASRVGSAALSPVSSTTRQPTARALLRCVVAQAGKLDDMPLFGGSSSSSSSSSGSSSLEKPASKPAGSKMSVDDVPLASEVSMDYTALRDHLKDGDWRKAEDETRALLIRLAGEDAVKRGWVYFTEVKFISVTDFQTVDNLWRAASNNKFGYSVQKEVFSQCQKRWGKFFKQIDWVQGENNNYRKWPMEFNYSLDAPKGHLPLTNALRGTQVFTAILEHPAWNKAAKKSIDDVAREAGKDTMKF